MRELVGLLECSWDKVKWAVDAGVLNKFILGTKTIYGHLKKINTTYTHNPLKITFYVKDTVLLYPSPTFP